MKKNIVILVGILSMIACKQTIESKPFEGEVYFENVHFTREGSKDTHENYELKISFLQAINSPDYLQDSINNTTLLFLSRWFGSSSLSDIEIAINKHKEAFDNRPAKSEFGEYQVFNLDISTTPVYQNKQIVSFGYDWYAFEGGAHGNNSRWCLMFDKKNGKRISYKDLVKDETSLLRIAESYFCKQHDIDNNKSLYETYSFKDNKFYLTENFMFSEEQGLSFYYNPYDIAPYVVGLVEINLPFEDIKEFVNYIDL